ncbi:MAG: hypothetical protein IJZ89_04730 [Clostridia bacterium]|nr:hypothetical protein [Clostridia bacterium]
MTENIATQENSTVNNEHEVLKTPPALTVVCGESSIEALKGTTSWRYDNGDGTSTYINSDSIHPLYAKDYMTPLSLMPTYASHANPLDAYLFFETAPDKISVLRWNEDCWEKSNAAGNNISVKKGGNGSDFMIELKDGAYIYEVIAEWTSSKKYGGTARYSFYTVKPNMEMHPIEENK